MPAVLSTKPLSDLKGERRTGRAQASCRHRPVGRQQRGSLGPQTSSTHRGAAQGISPGRLPLPAPSPMHPKKGPGLSPPPVPPPGGLCAWGAPRVHALSMNNHPKVFHGLSWCPEPTGAAEHGGGISVRHFVGSAPKSYPQPSPPAAQSLGNQTPPGPGMKPAHGKGLGDAKFPFSMPLFPFL